MARKRNKMINIATISSYENTMVGRERFNPYQTGHGAWKSDKHPSRARKKAMERRSLSDY